MATKTTLIVELELSGYFGDQTKYRSMVGEPHVLKQQVDQILYMQHVIVPLSSETMRTSHRVLNGSFATLKTPLTWGSGIDKDTGFELTAFFRFGSLRECLDSRKEHLVAYNFYGVISCQLVSKKQGLHFNVYSKSESRFDAGNPFSLVVKEISLNLPDHRIRRRCCSLIPAKSDS
ncbi:hypothetical protein Tco_1017063 [Tanacetum coccineum]|uniref:Uncharacterized protein n=1 Tax=Tanacetum coccineum TaxID=301880 RepID=A0ABQ5FRS9_9ASTR